jgi:hypothetical protein
VGMLEFLSLLSSELLTSDLGTWERDLKAQALSEKVKF